MNGLSAGAMKHHVCLPSFIQFYMHMSPLR